jgi:hypothetical protein
VRTALLTLLLGLAGCGKKQEAPSETVDLAAIRARRDSIRKEEVRDSLARVRYATCSDSVQAALAKAAKKPKKGAKPAPPPPAGMIPPEVLTACGKPPAPLPTQVAQTTQGKIDSATQQMKTMVDSTAKAAAAKQDTTGKTGAAKKDTTKLEAAVKPAAPAAQPAKPVLTAQQRQVLRADSIRQARERAKQDSLRQVAEQARQDSIAKSQRDSVKAESLKVARETEVVRETFTYAGGARDPFASLITEEKVGPEFNDLLLVGVYLDLRRASNSVAVLRDKTNQKRYKLRVGDRLGRLKVAQIRQTDVVFTVEDIGFERQETLSLRKKEEQTP